MTTPNDYIGRCRGLVIRVSEWLPTAEVDWAMHLVDHGEPAEGLASLAWSIESARGAVDTDVASIILHLVVGLVPIDALPPSVQAVAGREQRNMPGEHESE